MRIAFLSGGAREAALRILLENNENVCGVITPYLTNTNRRFEKVVTTAIEYGVPVFPVSKNDLFSELNRLQPDIIVSCGFPFLIGKSEIASAKYAINVHPTLLPKYRGYRSGAYILINNEKKTGVTVHFITEEMDRGDIILQREVDLTPFDTPKSMHRKCQEIEPRLLYDAIQFIKANNFIPMPQDEKIATEYLKLRTPLDSEIDPKKSLIELFNDIRACDPTEYPAFFYFNNEKVCIRLWRPEKKKGEEDMI